MEHSLIVIILLVLVAAFASVMALNILRWPTIPAYFVAGLVVGPNGLGVLQSGENAHFIAEFGVIFLLFTIGVKISLSSLRTMRRHVIVLGGLQTGLTMLAFAAPIWLWSGNAILSLLVGSVAAMSSTAIISQILIQENTLSSPMGRRAMSVLLFQDLAVIPLIVIFSTDANAESALYTTVGVILKISLIMGLVLFAGGRVMAAWLNWVSHYGDNELYMLNLITIIVVLSGLTAFAGLSYALGAFLAGILMSETMHRYRVMRIVEPFRQLFLGFFFMSLGVLVSPSYLAEHWPAVLLTAVTLLAVKAPLLYGCVRLAGSHRKTALLSTILLCGAGEFGFLLLTLARGSELVAENIFQLLLSANLLALMATPFLWRQREAIIRVLRLGDWLTNAQNVTKNLSKSQRINNHVIICGFGRTGQSVAGILRDSSVPYVAVEENYIILRAVGGTDNVVYGESTGADSLIGAGILRAKVLVVSFIDPVDSRNVVKKARLLNRNLFITAKADTTSMASILREAGANHVFVDAHETGFSIAKKSAAICGGASNKTLSDAISRARGKQNPFFTGGFLGADENSDASDESVSFVGCVVRSDVDSLATVLGSCTVISWLRDSTHLDVGDIDKPLQVGDELVLSGKTIQLLKVKDTLENEHN